MSEYGVDRAKWQALSLFEQMGNIGSEVGRTFSAQRRGDNKASNAALARAVDLFDATTSAKISLSRRKEILRAKEEFLATLTNKEEQQAIEDYFMQFAIAARLNR